MLAINKKAFDAQSFFAFKWQTNQLFKDIETYAINYTFSKLNFTLKDINTKNDLFYVCNSFQMKHSIKYLIKIFFKILHPSQIFLNENIQSFLFAFHYILRGPPLLS